jgi:hypothetical protein
VWGEPSSTRSKRMESTRLSCSLARYETTPQSIHSLLLITSQAPKAGSAVPVFAVDYNDVDPLTQTLQVNDVHTVISAISMYDAVAAQSELNLVAAVAKSSSTKRFVASSWGNAAPDDE